MTIDTSQKIGYTYLNKINCLQKRRFVTLICADWISGKIKGEIIHEKIFMHTIGGGVRRVRSYSLRGTDYSNIGFENMYGMNTWVIVSQDSNFSDVEEGHIEFSDFGSAKIYDCGTETLKFTDNTILQENWGIGDYDENEANLISDYTDSSLTYTFVDNYNLALTGGKSLSIEDVQMVNGIPFIKVYIPDYLTSGPDRAWYMPTAFIDWSRSPGTETVTKHTQGLVSNDKVLIESRAYEKKLHHIT